MRHSLNSAMSCTTFVSMGCNKGDSDTGTEVWLYAVERGGHGWSGYDSNMDFDASAEIWRFFSRYIQP